MSYVEDLRANQCGNKARFLTRGFARQAKRKLAKRRAQRGKKFQVYRCSFCQFFHVGSTQLSERKVIAIEE